jgi:glycine/D-amino acid oxidase-like deaminating enzyme
MKRSCHVAVLGAGIMGSTAALLLARKGLSTTLFDAAPEPMSRASRWNEGKIHLGFLYAADSSLETVRRLMPGGLAFKPLMEQLIGTSLDRCSTTDDEIYLIHRDSVVSAEAAARHFVQVADLLRHAAGTRDYLVDVSNPKVQELSRREIEEIADARQIAAAYRVPERSVSTNWIADRMVEAIAAERLIEPRLHSLVTGVRPADGSKSCQWMVETGTTSHGPFDHVVNALWEGKLAIDATVGLAPQSEWSHRYRLALFIRTRRPVESPTVVVMTGPFGDAKRFSDRDFYLSWYSAGLVVDDRSLEPNTPPLDDAIREQIERSTVTRLGAIFPRAHAIYEQRESLRVDGGWVFAMGAGSLANPASTLHRRDRLGILRHGTYISVDTGKYSMAPLLAAEVVDLIG